MDFNHQIERIEENPHLFQVRYRNNKIRAFFIFCTLHNNESRSYYNCNSWTKSILLEQYMYRVHSWSQFWWA